METKSKAFDPKRIKTYYKNMKPPAIKDLLFGKEKFTDPYFPPNENSLASKTENGQYVDPTEGPGNERELCTFYPKTHHKWKRISELGQGKWEIFQDKIEFDDVKQGLISDCYFLSAIAALSEYPNLIIEKFRTTTYNRAGYYEMVLFIDGEWQVVFVDDYFPFDGDEFVFAHPSGNELWAILLEKAWAKINGGYSNISYGSVYEVLLVLTGFPSEFITNDPEKPMELYDKIEKSNIEGAVMGCGSFNSESGKDDSKNQHNIVYSHAYTLIDAKAKKENDLYLFMIRNPWGRIEWDGDWSDNSPLWTEEYKKYFGHNNKDNGIFFMSVDDYVDNFEDTNICHIIYGAKIRSYAIGYEDYFKYPLVFNLQMKEKGTASFSIVTRDRRFNRSVPQNEFHPFSLMLFKYNSTYQVDQFYGGSSHILHLDVHQELEPGNYAVVIFIPYDQLNLGEKFKYTFQIASKSNYICKFAGKDITFECLETLLVSYYKSVNRKEINACKKYLMAFFKDVYKTTNMCPLMLYNATGNTLKFSLDFSKVKGYTVVGRYKGQKNVQINLGDSEVGIVLLAMNNLETAVSFKCGLVTTKEKGIDFDAYNPENFLAFDFEEDKNTGDSQIKTRNYNCMSKETAEEVPKLEKYNERWKKYAGIMNNFNPYDTLKKDYPKEFELLEKYVKESPEEINYKWMKIENKVGVYAGQVDEENKVIGRGTFFYANGKKYIGHWKNGNMDGYGLLFNTDGNLLYQGEFIDGVISGNGLFYINQKNYYIGEFDNNQMNGYGLLHFENGIEWEGKFVQHHKHGVGLLKLPDERMFIYVYNFDKLTEQFELTKDEIEFFKLKAEKIRSVQDNYILGLVTIQELTEEREIFLGYLKQFYEHHKENTDGSAPAFMQLRRTNAKKLKSGRRGVKKVKIEVNETENVELEDTKVKRRRAKKKLKELPIEPNAVKK